MPRAPTTADVFNAIAEERRRDIIDALATGPHVVGDLVEVLRLPQPAVSKHLAVLREVGIVAVSRRGRERVYRLNADELKPVHEWIKTFERFWTHQINRIKERAERKAAESRSPEGRRASTRSIDVMTTTAEETIHTLNIRREIEIDAPIEIAFEATLEEMGPGGQMPDGTAFPMKLEAWPGGRWFRDLGENAGHFWGHVQVIKPPKLLEICGPLFMSYPATSFVQYRLTEQGHGTQLAIVHRAMGLITQEHREGVVEGWTYGLKRIQEIAKRLKSQRGGKG